MRAEEQLLSAQSPLFFDGQSFAFPSSTHPTTPYGSVLYLRGIDCMCMLCSGRARTQELVMSPC